MPTKKIPGASKTTSDQEVSLCAPAGTLNLEPVVVERDLGMNGVGELKALRRRQACIGPNDF